MIVYENYENYENYHMKIMKIMIDYSEKKFLDENRRFDRIKLID